MSDLTQGIWSNWSGFQKAKPQQILQPVNIQELQSIVYEQQKIRVKSPPFFRSNFALSKVMIFGSVLFISRTRFRFQYINIISKIRS
jgi:hypothetical protein